MIADDLLPGANAAAAELGLTPRTVYNMVASGLLPAVRKGRRLYFRKSELNHTFSSEASVDCGGQQ